MTSEPIKARRAEVRIGKAIVDGFQLPDGSYRMSLSQAAEVVGLVARNAFDFLRSKAFESLVGEGYTVSIVEIESSQTRLRALPLPVVAIYWAWQSFRGNKKALSLTVALVTESLERRFDEAFGVSQGDQNAILEAQIAALNNQIAQDENELRRAFGEVLEAEAKADYLADQLRSEGIEPFALPEQTGDYP